MSFRPLLRPFSTLTGWSAHLLSAEIPVLEETARALAALRAEHEADDERVDAATLAEVCQADPLMTLKVFAHLGRHRSARRVADPESMTAAIMMLGVPPFLRAFADAPTVESRLGPWPEALDGLQRVVMRSHRASRFAIGFAIARKDPDAAVIHEAALLHDFAELLIWCHAPTLALEIRRRQQADPTLRSAQAQREVLHVELSDLEQALMRGWRLPELLVQITDHARADDARVRNVLLAVALARHTQGGWDNPAIPDDLTDIGRLLSLAPDAVRRKVLELDS